jgi:hypothetical protein
MASGIDNAMMTVERHEPRNSRIISDVSAAAMAPSWITPLTAAFTNSDWSPTGTMRRASGSPAAILGKVVFTPSMMASVEVAPFLSTVSSTDRRPSTCTTFCCGALPSRTKATSRMVMVAPLTTLTGRSFSAATNPARCSGARCTASARS